MLINNGLNYSEATVFKGGYLVCRAWQITWW